MSKNLPLPLVSIITVNFNQSKLTEELLKSLERAKYSNLEIIVVDNGSTEWDIAGFQKKYPYVKVVESKENLGFAGGNNLGIAAARGKYLMFLNNDTEVTPGFLEPLLAVFETNPAIGAASPKIKYYHSPNQNIIQWGGSEGVSKITVRGKVNGGEEEDIGQCNQVLETQLVHGAAMMVPFEVVKRVGLIPDIYFLYYEEHDWAEMIKRAGYSIYYVGNATVYHKESMTVGEFSPVKIYYQNRGRLIYTRRNRHGINKLGSLLFFGIVAFPKNLIHYLLQGKWELARAFISACMWNLQNSAIYGHPKLSESGDGSYAIIDDRKPNTLDFSNS
ncbi:glycosyltransferase family 2 protein [Algoriphagus sp. AGSA1]|uniref:glycosyltransferase family 2 protein n=1 Tax=Algoriphagus sp. AGSA1 TaxID=2907213 RepID=UPI001F2E4847|nr:glycosyltransferase family 2 protein [Algoriphagus sp. AGSA1]